MDNKFAKQNRLIEQDHFSSRLLNEMSAGSSPSKTRLGATSWGMRARRIVFHGGRFKRRFESGGSCEAWLAVMSGHPRLAGVGTLCLFGPLSVPTKSCFPFHSERYFRGRRRHEEEPEEEEKRR